MKTSVAANRANEITTYELKQNYPNPFNNGTIISFSIPVDQFVALRIYDILGREVTVLLNDHMESGSHEIAFNSTNLASGIYFYRLETGKFSRTQKMVLIK